MALDATSLLLITGTTAALTGYALGRNRQGLKLPWSGKRKCNDKFVEERLVGLKTEFLLQQGSLAVLAGEVEELNKWRAAADALLESTKTLGLELNSRVEALETAADGAATEQEGIKTFVVEQARRVGALEEWAQQADGALRMAAARAAVSTAATPPAIAQRNVPAAALPSVDSIAAMQAEFAARSRALADAAHSGPVRVEAGEGL
jgi:hypothetical protein